VSHELSLFIGMFTTLFAIINPLEALPVFLATISNKPFTGQSWEALNHQPLSVPLFRSSISLPSWYWTKVQ